MTYASLSAICQDQYFQQQVNTYIEVKLDDKQHFLSAYERIEYINNSPDKLDRIYLHIWPNAYKDNSSALAQQLDENGELDFHFADSRDRGYIDSLNFKINGEPVAYQYFYEPDVIYFSLKEPLNPGEKLIIETPFRVKIPKGIYSRLGHIGESYQITQWFPKPAVYDKDGWHPIPYLSQGEFYSEYGTYDVKITLPKNYVVGATGDLVDGENELEFLNSKVAETEEIIKNNSVPRNKLGHPIVKEVVSDTAFKTLHYHQENIHDFAWFADKRYHVLKGEVELPHSKRKVVTWAMFTNNEFDLWKKSIEYLNDATYYYSLWTGDYPYNHVTAVDGSISAGGGMEYPNVTVIGESYTDMSLEQVIVHEVGHNWFYGILGSNERVNAWMDEGLNTFMENRYTETKYSDSKMEFGLPGGIMKKIGLDDFGPRGMYDLGYLFNARRNYDQPIQTNSDEFTPTNYGAIVYGKTGIGFDYLLAYLGDTLFDECMHTYFDQWKFKHPQPQDIRTVFESVSGKNLSWLFDDYIKTTEKIDYKISGIKIVGDSAFIRIKNKEEIKSPLAITGISQGVPKKTIWIEGFSGKRTIAVPYSDENMFLLDITRDMPTIYRKDDEIRTSGMFKTVDPIRFKFLGSFEKSNENHVYYSPIMGWNAQDKFMLGMSFYNSSVPERKLEWMVSPMYAFGSNRLTGMADLRWNENLNHSIFRKIGVNYNFKSFSQEFGSVQEYYDVILHTTQFLPVYRNAAWYRHELGVNFELNTPLRSPKHNIVIRGINLYEPIDIITNDISYNIVASYILKNRQILKPASLKFSVVNVNSHLYGSFTGVSFEAKIRKNYNLNLKGFEIRLFAAQTLSRNEKAVTSKYNWSMSGQMGSNDYLRDYTLLGRSQSFPNMTNQQTTNTQGDFKVSTPYAIGSNDSWLVAANAKFELPIKLPIGIFFDGGLNPSLVSINGEIQKQIKFQYDGGVYLPIFKDRFEIYIPLFYCEDIKNQIDYQQVSFLQRIRFTLTFDELNPFKIVREIKP